MTSCGLDEWFWAMFEPTWIWPNFTFGQLFMWIGANNDQIWLPMGKMNNSEQCSNRLELDLISLLVNYSYELGQIMARFDFLWPRWVIVSNHVQTDFQLCIIDHVLLDSGALRPKGLLFTLRQFSQKLFDNFFSIYARSFPRRVLMNYQKMDSIE